jgi:hypothetical protein
MSEKATLLTSIPPVQKEVSSDKAPSLLSSTPVRASNELNSEAVKAESARPEGRVSLLSQTRPAEPTLQPITTLQSGAANPVGQQSAQLATIESSESVASEAVAEEASAITAFQAATYGSFVLNFVIAGAAAVILFKKASKLAEERFAVSAKTLAIAAVLIMLHGFFATYLYMAHLRETVSSAPLFWTMAVWILVGPAVGFITRNLLARQDKPNRKAAFTDAGIYGVIFFLTACGVSSGIKTNAALLASLLAGFLMIVPIARSLTAFNVAKARHKELNNVSDQILIYGLLLLPALLPVLAFAHVCGLSDSLTLFLINFITFDFLLVVGLAMIASADEFTPEKETQGLAEETAEETAEANTPTAEANTPAAAAAAATAAPATASMPAPEPAAAAEPPFTQAKPGKVISGNPDDPIIQFLNSEEGAEKKPTAPLLPKSAPKSASHTDGRPVDKSSHRTLPPRKPGRPGIAPPSKPGSTPADKAPNAPSHLKAPAKPKKRF